MKSHILEEARITYTGDAFGSVQGWRFSLAQYLTDKGEHVPQFRGSDDIREDYEYEYLVMSDASIEEACYAMTVFDRARDILGAEGLDY